MPGMTMVFKVSEPKMLDMVKAGDKVPRAGSKRRTSVRLKTPMNHEYPERACFRRRAMPGMTMLFQVKDPAMLDMVKPGDKVKFRAEKAGGAIVVTEIQVAK